MTLRQKRLLEELPKNNWNVSKSARKAGYSDKTANSAIYTSIRKAKGLAGVYTIEGIQKIQSKAYKCFLKEKDHSNLQRSIEHMGIIAGVKRQSEVTNVNPEKVIIVDIDKRILPSENRVPELIPDEKPTSLIENKINGQ